MESITWFMGMVVVYLITQVEHEGITWAMMWGVLIGMLLVDLAKGARWVYRDIKKDRAWSRENRQ